MCGALASYVVCVDDRGQVPMCTYHMTKARSQARAIGADVAIAELGPELATQVTCIVAEVL